jgi:Spy/CpxP family protein refolding chaperone
LNPAQIAAMQAQITEDRKQVQPLLDRLEDSRRKLISIKLNGKFDADKVKSLAAEQSQIIKQLIVANALLETKLYRMLTSQQQEKLDDLRRQTLDSAKASFPEW